MKPAALAAAKSASVTCAGLVATLLISVPKGGGISALPTTAENMSWADSAGALISTAADLTRFWSAIGRGALLGPAQTREMRQTVPATGGDSASVPGSRYGLGIFFIPLSCGGGYWSHEGDVPGYNTIGAVSSDGRTTVALSINSNVDDPVLAAEYHLVDHVMCHR